MVKVGEMASETKGGLRGESLENGDFESLAKAIPEITGVDGAVDGEQLLVEAPLDVGERGVREVEPRGIVAVAATDENEADEFLESGGEDVGIDSEVAGAGVADFLFQGAGGGDSVGSEDAVDSAACDLGAVGAGQG